MRLAIPAFAAVLVLAAAPSGAPAQDLGRVLRPFVAPVDSLLRRGARKILRPPAYRSRARYVRPSPARRAVAEAEEQGLQHQVVQGELAEPKPFWPDAPQDVFDYVLSSNGAGIWGHGYGAIVVSMFAQSPIATRQRNTASLATSDNAEQTTGAGPGGSLEIDCGGRDVNRAEEATKQIAEALALAGNQQGILAELGSALQQAEEDAIAACPGNVPASLPERLRTMQDRLWTIRMITTSLRGPLQKFDDALTNEQKATLNAQPGPSESGNAPDEMVLQCYASVRQMPQWPVAQITRIVRPNKDQKESLAILNETSSQMSQLMMSSCPQKTLPTMARLDATLDWLDTALFAGVNIAVAVEDFYRNLSDEQKAKLDQLAL